MLDAEAEADADEDDDEEDEEAEARLCATGRNGQLCWSSKR
jgi:hypothetical protein